MTRIAFSLPFLLAFAACTPNRQKQLVGIWQAQSLQNEGMRDLLRQERTLLDTLGTQTPPAEWEARFGTRNLDSLKAEGRASLDEVQRQQAAAVRDTRFQFREDGVAIVNFGEGPDSATYTVDDDGSLVLDEMALKGAGARLSMTIEQLSADSLRLRFVDDGTPSTVSFARVPEK